MIKIKLTKKSFTLVEVLVACGILIILVSAVVALGVTLINSATLSRQRITAYYLAQEGIETIRQIRDSNLVDGDDTTGWKTLDYEWGVGSPYKDIVTDGSKSYLITTASPKNRLFLGPIGPINSGLDVTIDGVKYTRKITFAPAGVDIPQLNTKQKIDANAVRAIVTISWKFKGNDKNVEVRELITNWKQQL